ncbi:MAG TPA: hypothetical protein VKU38_02250 [Ktedonobacteraceae bacterium]|nr:hypothetical protein [Ktedonobacteraceae bacterium]
MQQSIGEIIRQVRRQRNFTQSELGGNRYSKSYVSAVERNKMLSSQEALRFFAEQLGQPDTYFTSLLEPSEQTGQLAVQYGTGTPVQDGNAQLSQDDTMTLLDMLLENTDLSQLTIHRDLPSLSPEIITALPRHKQFRFYYLMGLVAREKGALQAALNAFEYAFVLAPPEQQPAILDEIGLHYASLNDHHTALVYFERALPLLQDDIRSIIRFKIELHCADSYRASGIHERAIEYYELSRQHMQADYGIRAAGLLYLGLGYCTYAALQRKLALNVPVESLAAVDDMERTYQRAVSFLIQSRSVFQVTNDAVGEAQVRLTLAFILLDYSEQRRKAAQEKAKSTGKPTSMNCTVLLNDAEDQCRQVLLGWQDVRSETEADLKQRNGIVSAACSGLIHCALQRTMLARIEGYAETAVRELAHASNLCQQTLDMFKEPAGYWNIIRKLTSATPDEPDDRSPVLPRLLRITDDPGIQWCDPTSLVEVYFALGATCEELGRSATSPGYAGDCYTRATQYFQAMLTQAREVVRNGQVNSGYLTRCYSHCVKLLEERAQAGPLFAEEATKTLLDILKSSLHQR